ncbi:MAG: hypothetical protein IGS50_05680 [Synechococcales cyanobacterium C42_A2020_086]|jgi:hypothetical protein|nr:hypothetical protein [Synechococcales cyanobacterium C42_A2020_086]
MKLVFYCYMAKRPVEFSSSNPEHDLELLFFATPPVPGQRTQLRGMAQPVVITAVNHCWMTLELAPVASVAVDWETLPHS